MKAGKIGPWVILLFCMMVSSLAAQDWKNYTPLPDQINIEPPDASIPPKVAQLSGVWQGQLQSLGGKGAILSTSCTIVIEKIRPDGVSAIFSWGTWGGGGRMPPGWARAKGVVEGETIILTLGKDQEMAKFSLKMKDEKTAFGEYTKGALQSRGFFEKKQ